MIGRAIQNNSDFSAGLLISTWVVAGFIITKNLSGVGEYLALLGALLHGLLVARGVKKSAKWARIRQARPLPCPVRKRPGA